LLDEVKGQGVDWKLWVESIDMLNHIGFSKIIVWGLPSNKRAHTFYESVGLQLDGNKKIIDIDGQKCMKLRYSVNT
jgi:hypothetical protein